MIIYYHPNKVEYEKLKNCKKVLIDIDSTLLNDYLVKIVIFEAFKNKKTSIKDGLYFFLIYTIHKFFGINKWIIEKTFELAKKYINSVNLDFILNKYINYKLLTILKHLCKNNNCYFFTQEPKELVKYLQEYLEKHYNIYVNLYIHSEKDKILISFKDKIKQIKNKENICIIDDSDS